MRFWITVTALLLLPAAINATPQEESPSDPPKSGQTDLASPDDDPGNAVEKETEPEAAAPSQENEQPPSEETTDEASKPEEKELTEPTPKAQEEVPAEESPSETEKKEETDTEAEEETETKLHWRDDPKNLRHPGSYIGFGAQYSNVHTWFTPQEEEFAEKMSLGPFHSWQAVFRVGDALREWFAIGFQIGMTYGGYGSTETTGGFTLLLDTTFYPWRGLGIRPSVGLGFSYAQGKEDYEFGFGGPGCLSLSITYEFRISRLFAIAPIAQILWITGEDFNGLYLSGGLEFIKWFDTPTG